MGYTKEKLEQLLKSEDWRHRAIAAQNGYGLDVLINDAEPGVRCEVVRQRFGLEQLVYDPNSLVRVCVAYQNYGLDTLMGDEDANVRAAVARQGYRLDVFINDKAWEVREAVAEQGYSLELLIGDEDEAVRIAAELYCVAHKIDINSLRRKNLARKTAHIGGLAAGVVLATVGVVALCACFKKR